MTYELVITRTQPPCGGKSPVKHEIRSVETSDIIAYVRSSESDMPRDFPLEAVHHSNGTITVEFKSGASEVSYEFTED
ncbi:MAG: hypothetical protein IKQ10_09275 [Oscillospiraceae bacterium]|nr:hypothetical protein [Oscillospiraceae bacterium]